MQVTSQEHRRKTSQHSHLAAIVPCRMSAGDHSLSTHGVHLRFKNVNAAS